jgi:hypothetical protein
MIFEASAEPFPEEAKGMPLLLWLKSVFDAAKVYEETGHIALPMLPDERERMLVSRALAREPVERFASCVAFVEALRNLMT